MERKQRVHHGGHSHKSEQAGADLANLVAEVEKSDCKATKDDGEVEP